MNKLEEWFKEDCPNEPEHHFKVYEKGYNRAKIEELERQLAEAKARVNLLNNQQQLNNMYIGSIYERNY